MVIKQTMLIKHPLNLNQIEQHRFYTINNKDALDDEIWKQLGVTYKRTTNVHNIIQGETYTHT